MMGINKVQVVPEHLRILVITEYFYPDEASTGRFLSDLFRVVKQRRPGWEVEVVTGRRLYRATKRRALASREEWQGILIRRFRTLRRQNDGFVRRAMSDACFSARAAVATAVRKHDVLFVVTNPPLMPMALNFLGRARKPAVYLIHDLYPDVPVALELWRPDSLFTRALRWLQARTLLDSERVVVLGRSMRDFLVREYRVPASRISVIPNWTTTGLGAPKSWSTTRPAFTVLYSGNIGQFQDFDTLLDGAELLRQRSEIRFQIVGDGARAEWLRQEARNRGLSNMVFRPYLSDAEYASILAQADLGLITLEPGMEALGVPSKTYNLLASGLPILAVLGAGSEVARLIQEYRVGYRVDHGDAAGFSQAILHAYSHPTSLSEMSRRAIEFVKTEATLEVVAERYIREIESVAIHRDGMVQGAASDPV